MVGRVLPFLAYGWISQVAINNRGNKAYVLIQKQSHLFSFVWGGLEKNATESDINVIFLCFQ